MLIAMNIWQNSQALFAAPQIFLTFCHPVVIMKNRNLLKVFALMLVCALVLSAVPVPAHAVTQDEVDAMRAERDAIAAKREEMQAVVDQLEAEQAGVLERKRAMDERNAYTLQQIQLNNEEIAIYDEMIAAKENEVNAAKALEDQQMERYRVRIRAMEENGGYGILAMVLRTSNLSEFLTAMDDVGEIMESDRELEDAYRAARENTERVKADYEAFKTELEGKKAELLVQQEELQAEIDEATALIASLQEDIDSNREEVEAIMAEQEKADQELAAMVAELERQRQEEERRRREAEAAAAAAAAAAATASAPASSGGSVTGTGTFGWPVPSCTYITSRFGLRVHPITGEQRSHTGLDIGAGYGASIVAADGGTVSFAGEKGGYGNCVMINHGNGYVTLYGHMSSISVSQGQGVSKGETIGYVGSSGVATGPHCHFEIFSGGSRIDPEQFFSGLTFAESAGV